MTLEETIQTVVAARTQYHTVHQQVQHLREAWAIQYAPLLQEEALQKQAVRQAEEALRRLAIESLSEKVTLWLRAASPSTGS